MTSCNLSIALIVSVSISVSITQENPFWSSPEIKMVSFPYLVMSKYSFKEDDYIIFPLFPTQMVAEVTDPISLYFPNSTVSERLAIMKIYLLFEHPCSLNI